MKSAVIASALCVCASVASAQDSTQALYVSGQADFLQSDAGGSGAVEWLRTTSRNGIHAGVVSGSLADAWWTFGRAGGFVRPKGIVLGGTLDAGGGAQPAGRFGYQRIAGEVAVPLAAGRLLLETEGQLARMAADVRRILRLGFKWRPLPAVTAGANYYLVSVDGSVTPAVSVRADVERKRSSVLGGVVFARGDRPTTLVSHVGGATALTSTEFFGGGGFRLRSYRLQVVANVARQPNDTRRLLATLEIPIKR